MSHGAVGGHSKTHYPDYLLYFCLLWWNDSWVSFAGSVASAHLEELLQLKGTSWGGSGIWLGHVGDCRDGRPSSLHTSASKTQSLQTSKSEEVSPWLLIFSLHLVKMQSCDKMNLCISCFSVAMTMKFQHEHLFSHLRIQNNVDEEVRFFFLYLKSVKLKKKLLRQHLNQYSIRWVK